MRQFEQSIDILCQAEGEGLTGSSTSTASAPSATQPFNREITDNNVPYPRSSGRHINLLLLNLKFFQSYQFNINDVLSF